MSDVETINTRMQELRSERRLIEAAELVAGLPDGDLSSGPYFELWWHFCEELGDAVKNDRPALAARLYELALGSNVKEGSMASGQGEGRVSVMNQERIKVKLQGARSLG